MDIKKHGAVGILAIMMMGVISAAGNTLIENTKNIASIIQKELSVKETLREIKDDVKEIKSLLILRKRN